MGKYCCFLHPEIDFSEKSIDDYCPKCRRSYGFPLRYPPATVGDYTVVRSLSRGFYAATYVVRHDGGFNDKFVLKISPCSVYEYFQKDFRSECKTHHDIALDTDHIVEIHNYFDRDVQFGDVTINCHVAVLKHIEGDLLSDFITNKSDISATSVAQIAVDLLAISSTLRDRKVYHNDLHGGNIMIAKLRQDNRRLDAMDPTIRAVAIDLGSAGDESKSDDRRLGDLHWISTHLGSLVRKILDQDNADISDFDYRVASRLDHVARWMSTQRSNLRFTPKELSTSIREACLWAGRRGAPWRVQRHLSAFDDYYNMQQMEAWNIPRFFVRPDPDSYEDSVSDWLDVVQGAGPLAISGMRGCGKTMLLKSVSFHARASQLAEEGDDAIFERLSKDNYVGLYVSASRLLDSSPSQSSSLETQLVRLFVAYSRGAIAALKHLRDLNEHAIHATSHQSIGRAVSRSLALQDLDAPTAYDLERLLIDLELRSLEGYTLQANPAVVFKELADSIRRITSIWNNSQVLFLLDDVSTRYFEMDRVAAILSSLIFQDSSCSFKFTTEDQTLVLGLSAAPGSTHNVRVGRDLKIFDLGREVSRLIKVKKQPGGGEFIADILQRRIQNYPALRRAYRGEHPKDVLGDVSLESIAKSIAKVPESGGSHQPSGDTSSGSGAIYYGISAIVAVCVGDIGDVISLYARILREWESDQLPVSKEVQSKVFKDYSSQLFLIYSRKQSRLGSFARSFASASHHLLKESRQKSHLLKESRQKSRIRQYLSLEVRIDTDDVDGQLEELRTLVDGGVFVIASSRRSENCHCYRLTFRKLLGLESNIGLAERDRFQLSGKALDRWLDNPQEREQTLLQNSGGHEDIERDDVAPSEADEPEYSRPKQEYSGPKQMEFEGIANDPIEEPIVRLSVPRIETVGAETLDNINFSTVLLGLGFEDRTRYSVDRWSSVINPLAKCIAVAYPEHGFRRQIEDTIQNRTVTTMSSSQVLKDGFPKLDGNILIDITGLMKPLIFDAVRSVLLRNRRVWICHTEAKVYYPRDKDIRDKCEGYSGYELLEALHDGVLMGERGGYNLSALLSDKEDYTRLRALCAFSSAKHGRLLKLLDEREYDLLHIVTPTSETSRSMVARVAADLATVHSEHSEVSGIDSNDVAKVIDFITSRYRIWSHYRGYDYELGLTGSKLQTVACAIVSVAFRMAQCWYVQPGEFDSNRFTEGVGKTHFYRAFIPELEA